MDPLLIKNPKGIDTLVDESVVKPLWEDPDTDGTPTSGRFALTGRIPRKMVHLEKPMQYLVAH